MKSDSLKTHSTSRSSETAEDIILDEIELKDNDKFRLTFRPEIVKNPSDPDACVRGTFIYQRKAGNGEWNDHKTLDISKLKAEEWVKLEIKSGELKKLITELQKHYKVFEKYGIEIGDNEYLFSSEEITNLITQLKNPKSIQEFVEKGGIDIIPEIIDWMSKSDDPKEIINKLSILNANDLNKVSNVIGVANLKKAIQIWEDNKDNNDESFWQNIFKENSWLLSNLFSVPIVIIDEQAYVGGKSIHNQGGNVTDFLAKNKLTNNLGFIEIKTPTTPLMHASPYRGNLHLSRETMGGITQVLSQKDKLLKEFTVLKENTEDDFTVLNPKGILLAGRIDNQLTSPDQLKSFDLTRGALNGVEIVTFDEFFEKAKILLDFLEGNNDVEAESLEVATEISPEDIPF